MTCPNPDKVAYDTVIDALTVANENRMKGNNVTNAYPCQCGKWHLSHWRYAGEKAIPKKMRDQVYKIIVDERDTYRLYLQMMERYRK